MSTTTETLPPPDLPTSESIPGAGHIDALLDFKPIPGYGDVMTISEWIAAVRGDVFEDDDGDGYWATASAMSDQKAVPSQLGSPEIVCPDWATRVVWFNR